MNWLVKSHPSDFKNSGKLKTKDLFFSKKHSDNIKFFPENLGRKNLDYFVSTATAHFLDCLAWPFQIRNWLGSSLLLRSVDTFSVR